MVNIDDIKNTVVCADSSIYLKQLPDRCMDMIVTSPPYDDLRSYNGFTFDFETIAHELYRILKSG